MTRLTLLFLSFFVSIIVIASGTERPIVPSQMVFAGMKLKITAVARRDIQKDVDALVKSPKYLEIKADRARLYFPIIEAILKEESVPEDLKYLALQESALISDAVSSANAVGFWQFKDFTGREVGLRIDRSVDERLNIVSSTRGAALYFKRNNFYFRNWIYTLLAHMTGRGGAKKYVDRSNFGKDKMTLDGKTHWYVKRFLAHKIVYEGKVHEPHSQSQKLIQYRKGKGKTLSSIAKETKSGEDELKRYNKWLKYGKVPTEKEYIVIIPVKGNRLREEPMLAKIYPEINKNTSSTIYVKINGIPSVLAKKGDNIVSLAKKLSLTPKKLAKYNDLKMSDSITKGGIYYMKSKRNRAKIYFYTVQPKESLWKVSQKFGIKLVKLARLNRMMTIDDLKTGRVLWLRRKRPVATPVEYRNVSKVAISEKKVVANKKSKMKSTKKVKKKRVEVKKEKKEKVINHLVIRGETLYSIAIKMGVSVGDLMEWNGMRGVSLRVGQNLLIYGGGLSADDLLSPVASSTFHLVKSGDTMYGISRKYGVSIDKLLKINKMDNFNLSVGKKVKIKL